MSTKGHGFPAQLARPLPPMPAPVIEHGLCTRPEYDPDLWSSGNQADAALARRVCRCCPVRPLCSEWSLSLPEWDHAVYGGLPWRARIAARRERVRQP
jgi:hypothetical protein